VAVGTDLSAPGAVGVLHEGDRVVAPVAGDGLAAAVVRAVVVEPLAVALQELEVGLDHRAALMEHRGQSLLQARQHAGPALAEWRGQAVGIQLEQNYELQVRCHGIELVIIN
jgi:hypothetical protein